MTTQGLGSSEEGKLLEISGLFGELRSIHTPFIFDYVLLMLTLLEDFPEIKNEN